MSRVWNFSAGPSVLPLPVLERAREELTDWKGIGASVMEISHRSAEFIDLADRIEADFRRLLGITDDYAVLFTAGGATTAQALIPLNFAAAGQTVDVVVTGHWSKTAIKQAAPYVRVHEAATSAPSEFTTVPPASEWVCSEDAAYLHYTANETIHGVAIRQVPQDLPANAAPLVVDFSSSIASEPIDVSRYGILYAGAQKNLGPVGISVVVVRRDLLERAGQVRADIFDYRSHVARDSMLNTPPTFNWYLLGLTVEWMIAQGGTPVFRERNEMKARMLYDVIDGSGGFFRNPVEPAARSIMNVPFFLPSEDLDARFVALSRENQMLGLKGHKAIGGVRASIYNAMPVEGVETLASFMREFRRTHG